MLAVHFDDQVKRAPLGYVGGLGCPRDPIPAPPALRCDIYTMVGYNRLSEAKRLGLIDSRLSIEILQQKLSSALRSRPSSSSKSRIRQLDSFAR